MRLRNCKSIRPALPGRRSSQIFVIMHLELPDQLLESCDADDVKLALAIGMYASRRMTLGQASELCGLSQGQLQRELGRRQIPAHYDLQDFEHDLKAAESMCGS